MQDQKNELKFSRVISPVSVSDNTAQVGQVIDVSGYESVTFVTSIGSVGDADATFVALLEHSDASGSGFAAVDDAYLIGTEADASFQFDSDNGIRSLGYRGPKRYLRYTLTPANNASAAVFGVVAVLGNPRKSPV